MTSPDAFRRIRTGLLFFITGSMLAGCPSEPPPSPPTDFRSVNELRVGTRLDTISFQFDENEKAFGLEYDLLTAFAKTQGIPVTFTVYPDSQQALRALAENKVHLVAAGLARDENLPFKWSPPLRELEYVLVSRRYGLEIETESELAGKTIVVREKSYLAGILQQMASRIPGLMIEQTAKSDQALLAGLAKGEYDLVASDSIHFNFATQVYPTLTVAWELDASAQIALAMPDDPGDPLPEAISLFLESEEGQTTLAKISDRYIGHVQRLDQYDIAVFLKRIETRLPAYRPFFEEAEQATGIDWRYLAAVSYQESHWNPSAVSRTGVRGMMMLTSETADWLGVTNRLDARQSIMGGSRYLSMLKNQLPDTISDPDRTWIATASYNIGMTPLNNARSLAKRLGKDNTSWLDMKTVLPLLAKPEYAKQLSGRKVRGGEAVIMTENVRNFYAILKRHLALVELEALESAAEIAETPSDPLEDEQAPANQPPEKTLAAELQPAL